MNGCEQQQVWVQCSHWLLGALIYSSDPRWYATQSVDQEVMSRNNGMCDWSSVCDGSSVFASVGRPRMQAMCWVHMLGRWLHVKRNEVGSNQMEWQRQRAVCRGWGLSRYKAVLINRILVCLNSLSNLQSMDHSTKKLFFVVLKQFSDCSDYFNVLVS